MRRDRLDRLRAQVIELGRRLPPREPPNLLKYLERDELRTLLLAKRTILAGAPVPMADAREIHAMRLRAVERKALGLNPYGPPFAAQLERIRWLNWANANGIPIVANERGVLEPVRLMPLGLDD